MYLTHQMTFLRPSLFIIIILLVILAKGYRFKPKILAAFWLKIPNVTYKYRQGESVMFTLSLNFICFIRSALLNENTVYSLSPALRKTIPNHFV